MKYFYRIDGFCDERFETLWEVKHHLSLYSPADLKSADGYLVFRYNVIDDEHEEVDFSFCRRIDVCVKRYWDGSSYLTYRLIKV